ncbi:unnamed protein product, partial [Ectocarpus sp. 4 AP-2014]
AISWTRAALKIPFSLELEQRMHTRICHVCVGPAWVPLESSSPSGPPPPYVHSLRGHLSACCPCCAPRNLWCAKYAVSHPPLPRPSKFTREPSGATSHESPPCRCPGSCP